MSARKSAHSSSRYTWTTTEARDFVKHLEKVKRPDEPLEGRDEFLMLHPVSQDPAVPLAPLMFYI